MERLERLANGLLKLTSELGLKVLLAIATLLSLYLFAQSL